MGSLRLPGLPLCAYRFVYGKLGHLVEGHFLHNHLPHFQFEFLAQHQLHRLVDFLAIVHDSHIVGPTCLKMEFYLQIEIVSYTFSGQVWPWPSLSPGIILRAQLLPHIICLPWCQALVRCICCLDLEFPWLWALHYYLNPLVSPFRCYFFSFFQTFQANLQTLLLLVNTVLAQQRTTNCTKNKMQIF